jgi:hypothetical protein
MEDKRKTKSQLMRQLVEMRQPVGKLEASKIECDHVKTESKYSIFKVTPRETVGNLIYSAWVKNRNKKRQRL